jgi:hypothetical protein
MVMDLVSTYLADLFRSISEIREKGAGKGDAQLIFMTPTSVLIVNLRRHKEVYR